MKNTLALFRVQFHSSDLNRRLKSDEYCAKQKLATHTYLITWEHWANLTNDAYSKGWVGHDCQALDGRC
jgi:hypothetical protein